MSLKLGTTDISGVPTTLISTVNNKLDASTYTSNPRTNAVYIAETYHNGSSWYRVWSDGFIEQGGHKIVASDTQNSPVSFIKNFSNTDYTLVTNSSRTSTQSASTSNATQNFVFTYSAATNSMTTSGFNFSRTSSVMIHNWYACGY